MIDLEQDLRALGEHLDHPSGDQIVPRLRMRLSAPSAILAPRRHPSRRRLLVASLASVAAVVLLAVAIPPSRDAIADILGLGSRTAPRADHPAVPHHHPTSTTPPTRAPLAAVVSLDLAAARAAVEFPIRVPGPANAVPTKVTVDRRVPGGLVALEYPAFTVVEVSSPPDAAVNLAPMIANEGEVHVMSVRGRPALWITGDHDEIPYFDRDGTLRRGAPRPTGHVLLWEENGVTYRVEGFEQESSAAEMATSIA